MAQLKQVEGGRSRSCTYQFENGSKRNKHSNVQWNTGGFRNDCSGVIRTQESIQTLIKFQSAIVASCPARLSENSACGGCRNVRSRHYFAMKMS